jgi:hypothetical protein
MVSLLAFLLCGCGKSWTWHQKITVSVITPDGIVTSSSVVKAGIGEKGGWWAPPEATGATTSLTGEAVVLELAPNRYLFGLLTNMPRAYHVFFPHEPPLEVAGKLESLRDRRELTPDQYPVFVTFSDVNDPTSVKSVDPADLAAVFGPGYKLNSVTLSITDEPVTEGELEKVLGWINNLDDFRTSSDNPFTNTLPEEIGYLRSG